MSSRSHTLRIFLIYFVTVNQIPGWTLSLFEYESTIMTLWETVKSYIQEHPDDVPADNMLDFISNDHGNTYNLCHFWSNFEIGDLNFWRSDRYLRFFEYLDEKGGFFYERCVIFFFFAKIIIRYLIQLFCTRFFKSLTDRNNHVDGVMRQCTR